MILNTFIAIILSAFLYRLGGMEGLDNYIGWLDKFTRDWGCPLVAVTWMYLHYPTVPFYIHLISFGLMWAAISTYWDEIFSFDNYYFHGFVVGLSFVLYAYSAGNWIGFGIRAIVLGIMMGWWCSHFSNAYVEEFGRGGFIALTLPIILLPF